jgi:ribosomal protein L14E/L6E/L27E
MGKPLNEYRVGQVVVSKRGKDAGRPYVIVGFLGGDRLALADAGKFNVGCPKSKNPKHVQPTTRVVEEIAALVRAGKKIDHGEFRRFLSILGPFREAESE